MIRQRIVAVARRLPQIARLQIEARPGPKSRSRWHGKGNARVDATRDADGDWLFHETGRMQLKPARVEGKSCTRAVQSFIFRNALRWHVDDAGIELAHQRFGADHEVALIRLIAGDGDAADLVSAHPHLCGADRYHARLHIVPDGFDLHWQVEGPDKDELLMQRYRMNHARSLTATADVITVY